MITFAIFAVLTLAAAGFGLYTLFPMAFKQSESGNKRWAYLFGAVLFVEMLLFAVAPIMNWWLPLGVSTYSWDVDVLFYAILAVTGVTFIGVSIVLVYILFKFGKEQGRPSVYTHGSHKLEMIWTGVPAVILVILGVVQIPAWLKVKASAAQADSANFQQLEVVGRQWEWRIRYPSTEHMEEWKDQATAKRDFRLKMPARPDDVRLVNEIHVVQKQKVLIHLKTQDVLHSFFLPQMRLKQDALPGKTIPVWFEATEANCFKDGNSWKDGHRFDAEKKTWVKDDRYIWELACAEFCGARHSLMRGKVFVHASVEDFKDWLKIVEKQQKEVLTDSK